MEFYERIRELRKMHLHMSQTEFGKQLGVSRSVINNIESNALAKPEQKRPLLKLICKEFSVNEEWLINGIEPMFIEPDTFNLQDFAKEHNITKLEMEIVKTYLELDSDIRKTLVDHFKNHLTDHLTDEPGQNVITEGSGWKDKKTYMKNENIDSDIFIPKTPEELEQNYPPVKQNGEESAAGKIKKTGKSV